MGLTWNYGDLLEAVGRRVPERVALIHDDSARTWGEVDARSNRVARAMLDTPGVEPGAHVAFYAANGADYLEALIGAFKARLVHLNINYRYVEDELVDVLDRGDARVLVYDSAFADRVEHLAPQLAKIELYVELGDPTPRYQGASSYAGLATAGEASPLGIERSGDDRFLLYTGGTTGTPKAVVWRQADRLAVYRQGDGGETPEAFLDRVLAAGGERVLPAAPLMHSTGLTVATRALTAGGSVVTTSGSFDADSVWGQVARHRVNSLAIVGDAFARPLLDALDAREDQAAAGLDSLRTIVSAGVMWSQEVKRGLLRHLPLVRLLDTFGSSEGSGLGTSVTDAGSETTTAVFQIGDGCKVFTPDHREIVPGSGEAGLIAKSGPIPLGYYGDPERSATTFPVIDGVRYSIPGDWCTVEADGTINLLGRDSSCINTGGEKVFPEEVEEAMKSLTGIDDALVVGIPDPRWGQAVSAVVQSGDTLDAEAIRRSLRDRLAPYKIPKRVLSVEQLPRSASGKADYQAVNRLFESTPGGHEMDWIETAPVDDLRELQRKRLQWSVTNAYAHVPHYRRSFDEAGVRPSDIRSLDDLARLPFTTKQDLRDNYPFGMFAVPREQVRRVHASSGTTGKPTVVGYTEADIDMWADVYVRSLRAGGVRPGDVVHVAYGYGLFTGGLGAHYAVEQLGCTAVPASTGQTARQVQLLCDFDADVLTGTPSYALVLADEFRRQGIDPSSTSLRLGLFGAEPWSEAMRAEIENAFGIEAVDVYGLSEVIGGGVAIEYLQAKDGPTIWEDHFYPEIVDPETGEVLPDGETGELVFTSLTKQAMPVIRYRTRDLCALAPGTVGSMRRMTRVAARTDDMLIIKGVNVFPSQFEEVVMADPRLSPHFQLEVRREGRADALTVLVEPAADAAAGDGTIGPELVGVVRQTIGIGVDVEVVSPGTIERSAGKAQRVRRKEDPT